MTCFVNSSLAPFFFLFFISFLFAAAHGVASRFDNLLLLLIKVRSFLAFFVSFVSLDVFYMLDFYQVCFFIFLVILFYFICLCCALLICLYLYYLNFFYFRNILKQFSCRLSLLSNHNLICCQIC